MNVLGVILARAGSEGLRGKHLRSLRGRPVISYTFDHARSAASLTHVVVSSDCPHVLNLAAEVDLPTIRRPPTLATAEASVQAVLLQALQTVEADAMFRADAVVALYGNVPIRPDGIIDRAVKLLSETGCDSVRSFCPVGKWHPAWMSRIEGDRAIPLQAGSIHRRQDLTALYLHDGAVVAVSRGSMLRGLERPDDPHAFFGEDRRAVLCGAGETVEIDTELDLLLAETILRQRSAGRMRMAS